MPALISAAAGLQVRSHCPLREAYARRFDIAAIADDAFDHDTLDETIFNRSDALAGAFQYCSATNFIPRRAT